MTRGSVLERGGPPLFYGSLTKLKLYAKDHAISLVQWQRRASSEVLHFRFQEIENPRPHALRRGGGKSHGTLSGLGHDGRIRH